MSLENSLKEGLKANMDSFLSDNEEFYKEVTQEMKDMAIELATLMVKKVISPNDKQLDMDIAHVRSAAASLAGVGAARVKRLSQNVLTDLVASLVKDTKHLKL